MRTISTGWAMGALVAVLTWSRAVADVPDDATQHDALTLTREFDVAPSSLWRAWTQPEQMRRWFGSDPHGRALDARVDLRIGGAFSVTFADSDGTEHTASGEYLAIVPQSKLVFTWRWRSEPGVSSMVTVTLAPHGQGVLMGFEHAGIGYGSAHNYEQGWQQTFDKIERVAKDLDDDI